MPCSYFFVLRMRPMQEARLSAELRVMKEELQRLQGENVACQAGHDDTLIGHIPF